MTEHLVFVREFGQVEYDIIYVPENVTGADETEHPITIEELHALIKDALGRNEVISKITLDEIAIRNTNGIRFMFKRPEPKLEVTFEGSEGQNQGNSQGTGYGGFFCSSCSCSSTFLLFDCPKRKQQMVDRA